MLMCCAEELADKSGLSERYLEEWCRAAALHGYLELEFTKGGDAGKEWDSGIQIRGVERYSMRYFMILRLGS